jgi:hypothetical protein
LALQCARALVFFLTSAALQAEPARVAERGSALQPVVIAENAAPTTKAAAERLAGYLERITSAKFPVKTGDGVTGIAVGLVDDFPALESDVAGREEYVLHSHAHGLHVIGAKKAGLDHAVWDLLYRIGYRQFFPGPTWEVVPAVRDLTLDVQAREQPVYLSRKIWYGFGGWDFSKGPYADWCEKNRASEGFQLNTGHSYDTIIHKHEAEFKAHPEYYALVGGVRKGPKMCIGNPELRKLVVADALDRCAKDPTGDSISMDPSDGGGWCECPECAKLGSVTDQALFLANEVAAAINVPYPGRVVGMYAYNYHSPPPHIAPHPQVVISVATAFIKGGLTLDQLIEGWSAKGTKLGIREYYSVNVWDRDLPGAARGGNLAYLTRTIPYFASKGAQYLSAESSDNWGPNGLGYYLAARMLWNPKEAEKVPELVEDFLTRAFGPAKEPMRKFYTQLDGSVPHLVQADQLGRMFRALEEARKLDLAPEVRARIDALTLYARYVDLFHAYSAAKGDARQAAFEALIRHAYRMSRSFLVHSLALYRDLDNRDKSVFIPTEAKWNIAEGKNPWKSTEPFTAEELGSYIKTGLERNPLTEMNFQPVAFSENLVSAAPLHLTEPTPGALGAGRGKQTFYTYIDQPGGTIELQITGGLIAHYRDRGNVRIGLWQIGGASETGERETLVQENHSVPPDGKPYPVKLTVKQPGVYKIVAEDGSDMSLIKLISPIPWSVKSTNDEPMNHFYGDWTLYFYVPRGTKTVGLFGGERGDVCDSGGKSLFSLNGRAANFYGVPVPEGQDGKLWQMRRAHGSVRLLTVPPYFARTAAELLLPAEVVAGKPLQ